MYKSRCNHTVYDLTEHQLELALAKPFLFILGSVGCPRRYPRGSPALEHDAYPSSLPITPLLYWSKKKISFWTFYVVLACPLRHYPSQSRKSFIKVKKCICFIEQPKTKEKDDTSLARRRRRPASKIVILLQHSSIIEQIFAIDTHNRCSMSLACSQRNVNKFVGFKNSQ
jgi:hypothetical protein